MKRSEFVFHLYALLYEMGEVHPSNIGRVAIRVLNNIYHQALEGEKYDEKHPLVVALIKLYELFFQESFQTRNFYYRQELSMLKVIHHLDEAWEWFEERRKMLVPTE